MGFCSHRRRLLKATGILLPLAGFPALGLTASSQPRRLSFFHTHTSEHLDLVYYEAGTYIPAALEEINRLLRDFRSEEIYPIDRHLLDLLHTIHAQTGRRTSYEIISGYRSPATNQMLREKSGGVAKRSLHMQGRAIDVRLQGFDTNELRRIARSLGGGGVGYYPESDFLHLDTGRVRYW